jgi:alpha-2-macroglobulin-like protein
LAKREVPPEQAEVMTQMDLSSRLRPGANRLRLAEKSGSAVDFQVAFHYYVPETQEPERAEPLSITLVYDHSELEVGQTVAATATVTNNMPRTAPMVLLDLPVPPGFQIETDDLEALKLAGTIARHQINARSVLVYLRRMQPGQTLKLRYRLRATMPVKATSPSATVYQYYDPHKKGTSRPVKLTVGRGLLHES